MCRTRRLLPLLSLAALSAGMGVKAQDSAKSTSQKPKASQKVWTNDTLPSVRQPWDNYADRKETAVQADAKKDNEIQSSVGTSKPEPVPTGTALEMPKSLAEFDQRIAEKKAEVQYQQDGIKTIQEQLASAAPERHERLERNLKKVKSFLENAQRDLKVLQDNRETLISTHP